MSKDTATNVELSKLHKQLAKSMNAALQSSEQADYLIAEFGEELPTPVISFLEQQQTVNPSLLTAVAKFLKDNNITCAIEDSDEQSELARHLERKSNKTRTVGNVTHLDDM